ncbi:MAG: hypothetical protein NWE86_04965 [Candidatus Bathyarchaeota archaeon]|nr:hypothetical protein [Candidatus Bathyarchaeota archaeon]
MSKVINNLLDAIDASDAKKAIELFQKKVNLGIDSWKIHDSLFPIAQRVQNPPYINPHLPKMYRIYRELVRYLEKDEISPLVNLEVNEYARRTKLEILPKITLPISQVSFKDVESALKDQDWEKTAALLYKLHTLGHTEELARKLLLIGSGYLDNSLGHSISCTAFILLEIMERKDQDPWPGLVTLAYYFCKGQFNETPKLQTQKGSETQTDHMLRSVSGSGIINLHHTITRYAIERVRQLFTHEEHSHLINSWITFMDDKKAETVILNNTSIKTVKEYTRFYDIFSSFEVEPTVTCLASMLNTQTERERIGRFLVRALCDLYQGSYDPHYLTGLGSVLWVVDQYWQEREITISALYQYIDYFFQHLI